MKKIKPSTSYKKEVLPVFDLNAFNVKAKSSDFYIQNIQDHIKEHAFVGKAHKHDFYLILFVEEGAGVHNIDFVQYPVEAKSIFLMTPGQVHTWTIANGTKGWVVFFTRAFYEMHLSQNSLLEFPFYHSLVVSPVIRLSRVEPFKFAIQHMYEEYNSSDVPNLRIIRAYLDIFLLEAAKLYQSEAKLGHDNTFKLRKLEQLIEQNFRTLKQPRDYGELMNLAPSYLNSICKESLNKTLSELIHGRLLLEAKRMFAYSDMNVNEVAAKLNFSDPSYFTRWFKKQNGTTAEEFRNSI